MAIGKSVLLGAALVIGASLAANAQTYYPAQYYYPPAPGYLRQPTPPSWSYDPYTSGQTACPQKRPGDLQSCQDMMPPTYGQPSYWPTR